MLKLEQGRPADTAGRLEKEIRVYDFLDKLGVIYDRVDHEALMRWKHVRRQTACWKLPYARICFCVRQIKKNFIF